MPLLSLLRSSSWRSAAPTNRSATSVALPLLLLRCLLLLLLRCLLRRLLLPGREPEPPSPARRCRVDGAGGDLSVSIRHLLRERPSRHGPLPVAPARVCAAVHSVAALPRRCDCAAVNSQA